jgi:hypothetical protein
VSWTLIVPDNTEQRLTLPQADQARTDFAIIEDEPEAIHTRPARLPTRVTWRAPR